MVTARSADAEMVVEAVDELLAGAGSVLDVLTVAVLDSKPAAVDEAVLTTKVNAAPPAETKGPPLQAMVPVAPGAGVVQVNAGPLVWVEETNVVLAGNTSDSETPAASEGPLLVSVTV